MNRLWIGIGLLVILLGMGLGLLLGQCLESWLLCSGGGGCLLILGICCLRGT